MKKLLVCIFALALGIAHAATTVPVQLLNPTGSSSGQAVVSTGSSSAPGWGSVSLTNGVTGTLPVANGGTGVTSSTGSTSVVLSTSPTITTPNVVGVSNGSNATAGSVGEFPNNATSNTSLSTGVSANATSVALTAGDWDVQCTISFVPGGSVSYTTVNAAISTTSATFPAVNTGGSTGLQFAANTSLAGQIIPTPVVRVSLSGSGTAYCVANSTFSAGTMSVNGFIRARRVR